MGKYRPFDEAIEVGKKGEDKIQQFMVEAGAVITERRCRDNRRDFCCMYKHRHWKIEVKNEDHYANSPNICIEVAQYKIPRPSGVMVTKADICIHTFESTCMLFVPSLMRSIVADKPTQIFGDNYNQNILFNKDNLRAAYFPQIDEVVIEDVGYSRIWNIYP